MKIERSRRSCQKIRETDNKTELFLWFHSHVTYKGDPVWVEVSQNSESSLGVSQVRLA